MALDDKVGVKMEFKVKIQYKNGASETVFSIQPPNVNPVTPMFIDLMISQGNIRHVNMMEIRVWDLVVSEANSGLLVP
jgi:hypothetical protein